jgi:cytochrome c oxidase cbb3-type subunit 1
MYAHGLVFLIAGVLAAFLTIRFSVGAATTEAATAGNGAPVYNDAIIRAGVIASTFWGVVGFLVGLVLALQLAFPVLNLDLPWTTFGRLRPLHTSAVIFAFGGNVLIMCSFYVVQRTCRARLAGTGCRPNR